MITFKVWGEPIAQPRQRFRATKFGARAYRDKKHPVHKFKAAVERAAERSWTGRPMEGPIVLICLFVMPRPGRLTWKRRPMPRVEHTSKPDGDNLIKAVKDAITGIIWKDDDQVWMGVPVKVIASGNEKPHTQVWIAERSLADGYQISLQVLPSIGLQRGGSSAGGGLCLQHLQGDV